MYGLLPDSGRGLAFVVMLALSTLQVASKTLSTALLVVTNPSWLLYYMSGDIGLYFVQKICRRDLQYWIPLPRAVSIPLSVVQRVAAKFVVDYSGSYM
jgi:hypothetical protein